MRKYKEKLWQNVGGHCVPSFSFWSAEFEGPMSFFWRNFVERTASWWWSAAVTKHGHHHSCHRLSAKSWSLRMQLYGLQELLRYYFSPYHQLFSLADTKNYFLFIFFQGHRNSLEKLFVISKSFGKRKKSGETWCCHYLWLFFIAIEVPLENSQERGTRPEIFAFILSEIFCISERQKNHLPL